MEPDPFNEIPSSFYDAVFNRYNRSDITIPRSSTVKNLSMVSGLYLYNNPPPMAYGTPAPKVVETVKRAYEYNLKENPTVNIDRYIIDYPGDPNVKRKESVSSNFNPHVLHLATKQFLKENHKVFDEVVERVMDKYMSINADVLTSGRQTWDPLNHASVTCPIAFTTMMSFLQQNGFPTSMSLIELIQCFMELLGRKVIHGKKVKWIYKEGEHIRNGQMRKKRTKQKIVEDHDYEGEEGFYYVMDLIRSFCSYLKHKERAHLTRRAIASPSIPFRAFLLIIETVHLELGKEIAGSTISIGGEEKKAKILSLMNTPSILSGGYSLQATQDATKWNECLSASGFGMFHRTMTDSDTRESLGIRTSGAIEFYGRLCQTAHFILNIKRITLGDGPQGESNEYIGKISFTQENLMKFNTDMRKKVEWAIPKMSGEAYLDASAGMLMGMHNALSTTYGLLVANFNTPHNSQVLVLRSSDDSMTRYTGPTPQDVINMITVDKINYHLIGINLSDKKSFIFPSGFGEYTSWYQDGKIAAQYGVEVTTMRPSGVNPPDDFYNIARGTVTAQQRLEANCIGANVRLVIGINNVRSLYRIKKEERQKLSIGVTVLADGGMNPWDPFNCHLEETCLKETLCRNEYDHDYMLLIRDPDNPFSGHVEESVAWDPKQGLLTHCDIETPRTIFHYVRRANRTITNVKGTNNATNEKNYSQALKIINEADVSTHILTPASRTSSARHVKSCLTSLLVGYEFTDHEMTEISKAMDFLENGKDEEFDDEGAVNEEMMDIE